MENAGPIRPLEEEPTGETGHCHASLAHSRSNALSDSSYDINERWMAYRPSESPYPR